jgi:hypothetical protein
MLSDDIRFTMNTNKMSMAGNAFIENVLDEVIKLEKENEKLKHIINHDVEIIFKDKNKQINNLESINNELLEALKEFVNEKCEEDSNCEQCIRFNRIIEKAEGLK